jgi:ferredoxin
MCQLVCSLKQDKLFNPSQAYIKISSVIKPGGELDVDVSFDDNCDSCGLCVKYCLYDALARKKLPAVLAEPQAVSKL